MTLLHQAEAVNGILNLPINLCNQVKKLIESIVFWAQP